MAVRATGVTRTELVEALQATLAGHVADGTLSELAASFAGNLLARFDDLREAVPYLAYWFVDMLEDGSTTEAVLVDVMRWVATLIG